MECARTTPVATNKRRLPHCGAARICHDHAMTQGPYPIEILDTAQMARADSLAIAGGVSGMSLMENAAAAIARIANQTLQKSSGRRVLVLCGPGNNGGDGYVAAKLLRTSRIKLRVAALTRERVCAGTLWKPRWVGTAPSNRRKPPLLQASTL